MEELANLNIIKEEEEPFQAQGKVDVIEEDRNLCLVGCILTGSVVHFLSMRNRLVDLWHPLEGVSITDIGKKRSLFRFYYDLDLKRVLDGMP
ncbi:hypothetical protein J1N35_045565 [Gossypium stocksii]|uniref:DUF4283 domain-containing protein n=1 Tax=Gossypium stocksii TaxID=47602 RepID=A0A9D3UBL5_9ROSI|nr:hypothetical protein J1N35_045565 [Gossypium stocksii]